MLWLKKYRKLAFCNEGGSVSAQFQAGGDVPTNHFCTDC